MSRTVLYATLVVLVAVLFGISFALNKQTVDPHAAEQAAKPPAEEMTPDKRAAMMREMKKHEVEEHKRMAEQVKKQQAAVKEKAARMAALGVRTPKSAGVEISDKWFQETPDGPGGIQKAIRDKKIIDSLDASQSSTPSAAVHPAPVTP